VTSDRFHELERRAATISDLDRAFLLAEWDQQVFMPPGGGKVRPHVLATLARAAHDCWIDESLGALLESLRGFEETHDPDSYEASLVRRMRADRDREVRVPAELLEEWTRVSGESYAVWVEARRTSSFGLFLPCLMKQVELARRYAACFDVEERYDALLARFEPGVTAADVRAVFAQLKSGLPPLIAEASRRDVDVSFLDREFSIEGQRELDRLVLERFGFREGEWRLDGTVHPFASALATTDVRMTTRYPHGRLSLFSSMHEGGHGLYEHNVDPALERTPLCHGASSAFHESQSRGYENIVGRSIAFWRWCYPHLQRALPDPFRSVELEAFHAAVNRVRPSLVRVDADEVTYGLHIILRFELEQDLVEGKVEPEQLPAVWNERIGEYLGVEVPDDARGVLQDVHWSIGMLGHFSTYALGNVIGAQVWERLRADVPDLDASVEQGDLAPVGDWLREHVWRHGRKFTSRELLERVVGGGLDAGPFLAYLRAKHGPGEPKRSEAAG